MRYFYDKRCTISTESGTKVKGALMKSFSVRYSNIPCSYREPNSGNLTTSQASRDTDIRRYTMNIEPQYLNVAIGDRVELYDRDGATYISRGFFIVEDIENYTNIKGILDNISLKIYQRVNE